MKKTSIAISIIAALLLGATAQAEMITMGGDQTAGTGTLTINQDITFEVTVAGTARIFVFDELVTDDGSSDRVDFSGLEWSVDGGPRANLTRWYDNRTSTFGDVTENDGFIYGGMIEVSIGSTITLHAGTGTMSTTKSSFNPWSSGDYDIFVTDSGGNQLTTLGVVPEPATAGLLGISGLILFGIRRLKKTYAR